MMKIQIEVQNIINDPKVPKQPSIQKWVDTVLQGRIDNAELCIRIVSKEESAFLNEKYRQKNQPTNVLAFPVELPEGITLPQKILGDIVICAEIVNEEAEQQNKNLEAHWAHMIIHGLLHLLGYDHIENSDADIMENIEVEMLQTLGYPNPYQYE